MPTLAARNLRSSNLAGFTADFDRLIRWNDERTVANKLRLHLRVVGHDRAHVWVRLAVQRCNIRRILLARFVTGCGAAQV
jgi:hypothetical protein